MKDEVESQLSAMFDGELPAAECELLSRRIDRDENLRARWSRYALIGACDALRAGGYRAQRFRRRVSAALAARRGAAHSAGRGVSGVAARLVWNPRWPRPWWLAVAGCRSRCCAMRQLGDQRCAALTRRLQRPRTALPPAGERCGAGAHGQPRAARRSDPQLVPRADSYVTPADLPQRHDSALRTQLADYIVAHSEYSTPLMRRESAVRAGQQRGRSDTHRVRLRTGRCRPRRQPDATRARSDASARLHGRMRCGTAASPAWRPAALCAWLCAAPHAARRRRRRTRLAGAHRPGAGKAQLRRRVRARARRRDRDAAGDPSRRQRGVSERLRIDGRLGARIHPHGHAADLLPARPAHGAGGKEPAIRRCRSTVCRSIDATLDRASTRSPSWRARASPAAMRA